MLRVEWKVHEVRNVASPLIAFHANNLNTWIARRLLKSLSVKQGIKYDDPASARDIIPFIEFHRLNVDEILDPIDSFSKYLSPWPTDFGLTVSQKLSTNSSIGMSHCISFSSFY